MAHYICERDTDVLKLAIAAWEPTRPRRWLAKYGGLVRVKGPLYLRTRYLALVREATERCNRDNQVQEGAHPEYTYRLLL
ncbi:hypothetical protein MRM75_06650 [bacterium 19CA06SA08-2]|uniref:Uncharacterized protein n=1 Tax=bacterium 19CA06SA08-2 TaxID=2920658 RepID=A0AAU6UAI3_UNCXX